MYLLFIFFCIIKQNYSPDGNTTRTIDIDRRNKNINQETLELKKVSTVLRQYLESFKEESKIWKLKNT